MKRIIRWFASWVKWVDPLDDISTIRMMRVAVAEGLAAEGRAE